MKDQNSQLTSEELDNLSNLIRSGSQDNIDIAWGIAKANGVNLYDLCEIALGDLFNFSPIKKHRVRDPTKLRWKINNWEEDLKDWLESYLMSMYYHFNGKFVESESIPLNLNCLKKALGFTFSGYNIEQLPQQVTDLKIETISFEDCKLELNESFFKSKSVDDLFFGRCAIKFPVDEQMKLEKDSPLKNLTFSCCDLDENIDWLALNLDLFPNMKNVRISEYEGVSDEALGAIDKLEGRYPQINFYYK